jgi:hypothetical protein
MSREMAYRVRKYPVIKITSHHVRLVENSIVGSYKYIYYQNEKFALPL